MIIIIIHTDLIKLDNKNTMFFRYSLLTYSINKPIYMYIYIYIYIYIHIFTNEHMHTS
jgi:hypothetical protein